MMNQRNEFDTAIATASHKREISCDDTEIYFNSVAESADTVIVNRQPHSRQLPQHIPSSGPNNEEYNSGNVLTEINHFSRTHFDEEPGLLNDDIEFSFNDQWLPHEIPDDLSPINQSMFDDDLIRIPSMDDNLRWSNENKKIALSSVGYEKLARAVASGEEQIHSTQISILEELKLITSKKSNKKATKPKNLITESEITDIDVICERGGKSNRHCGTKRYRGLIEQYKPKYQEMTAKIGKTNLSRELIKRIQSRGGRFLKKDEDSGEYYILSQVETTKKVSQALREKKVLKWVRECSI